MGLMVAAISLSVAGFGLARWLRADISHWYEGKELILGIAVIVVLTGELHAWQAAGTRETATAGD
jgi:hypothetical protein